LLEDDDLRKSLKYDEKLDFEVGEEDKLEGSTNSERKAIVNNM
jgi:hypothetical protein